MLVDPRLHLIGHDRAFTSPQLVTQFRPRVLGWRRPEVIVFGVASVPFGGTPVAQGYSVAMSVTGARF